MPRDVLEWCPRFADAVREEEIFFSEEKEAKRLLHLGLALGVEGFACC